MQMYEPQESFAFVARARNPSFAAKLPMAAVRYCRRPFAGATAATAVDMAATMVATASAWG